MLFARSQLDDIFRAMREKVKNDLGQVSHDEVASRDSLELAEELLAKYPVVCPYLGQDKSVEELPFIPENASSIETTAWVTVPFSGDGTLFQYHDRNLIHIQDPVQVEGNKLRIGIRINTRDIEALAWRTDGILKQINENLDELRRAIPPRMEAMKKVALGWVEERKQQIAAHAVVLGKLKATGFAVTRRGDGADKVIIPVQQKKIEVKKEKSDPELSMAAYEDILGVIESMVKVFERSPSVFKTMGEEDLRTILLVALNGLFKGEASGETFNGAGKTDILIRSGDSNVFIAECLIWDGVEHFRKKVTTQLFNYATWRDGKLAAIVFNRNKSFSDVIENMKSVTKALPGLMTISDRAGESRIMATMRRQDDSRKEFVLTCMAFEVPK